MTTEQKLRRKIPNPNELGCRLWMGGKDRDGYGRVRIDGRIQLAHRVTWEYHHGAVPEGFCVCHRCDKPSCCELTHLFLGTPADNAHDRDQKGRTSRGEGHGVHSRGERNGAHLHPEKLRRGEGILWARLTENDVQIIRQRASNGDTKAAIARAFGVDRTTVRHVIAGRTWKHVR